jgi:DNA-binding CsgD family transcriptional regulator
MLIPIEHLTGNIDIAKTPLDHLLDQEDDHDVLLALLKLTPREERILRLRFGIYGDGQPMTFQKIGDAWSLSKERIRHIEAIALRRLRNPKRSRILREIVKRKYGEPRSKGLEARHYVPCWKKPIIDHIQKYYYRVYYDFDFRRFYQGKMTTKELTDYLNSKPEGV